MTKTIMNLSEENLDDVPEPCKSCSYWEVEETKERWLIETLRVFGCCGQLLKLDEETVGYAQYGPPERFPKIGEYASGPPSISDTTAFLSCLFIPDEANRGRGLGEELLNAVITDLRKRGFTHLQTYARIGDANNPSGPAKFYIRNGFRAVDNKNPEFPLMERQL